MKLSEIGMGDLRTPPIVPSLLRTPPIIREKRVLAPHNGLNSESTIFSAIFFVSQGLLTTIVAQKKEAVRPHYFFGQEAYGRTLVNKNLVKVLNSSPLIFLSKTTYYYPFSYLSMCSLPTHYSTTNTT